MSPSNGVHDVVVLTVNKDAALCISKTLELVKSLNNDVTCHLVFSDDNLTLIAQNVDLVINAGFKFFEHYGVVQTNNSMDCDFEEDAGAAEKTDEDDAAENPPIYVDEGWVYTMTQDIRALRRQFRGAVSKDALTIKLRQVQGSPVPNNIQYIIGGVREFSNHATLTDNVRDMAMQFPPRTGKVIGLGVEPAKFIGARSQFRDNKVSHIALQYSVNPHKEEKTKSIIARGVEYGLRGGTKRMSAERYFIDWEDNGMDSDDSADEVEKMQFCTKFVNMMAFKTISSIVNKMNVRVKDDELLVAAEVPRIVIPSASTASTAKSTKSTKPPATNAPTKSVRIGYIIIRLPGQLENE